MTKNSINTKLLALSLMIFAGTVASSAQANKLNSPGSISVKDAKEENYPSMAKATLADALSAAQKAMKNAKPVEARLAEKNDYLVYKVKMLKPDNKLSFVVLDAGNLAVLKSMDKDEKYED